MTTTMRMSRVASRTAAHAHTEAQCILSQRHTGPSGPATAPSSRRWSLSTLVWSNASTMYDRPPAERFRIQFYAVCAARPIIEFRREQLMVRSAAAASSGTVMNLNTSAPTTRRSHSSISRSSCQLHVTTICFKQSDHLLSCLLRTFRCVFSLALCVSYDIISGWIFLPNVYSSSSFYVNQATWPININKRHTYRQRERQYK